jgi:hypothetical protein
MINFNNTYITENGKEVDMTIFTTAEGVVNHTLEEMYSDKVRVIGYKEMAKLLDNNLAFWKTFYNEMLAVHNIITTYIIPCG